MQKILAFAMSIVRQQGSLMRYCFSYITLEQVYLCSVNGSNNWDVCQPDQTEIICGKKVNDIGLESKIDTTYKYYFDNWYVQMDLLCKTEF